MAAIIAPIASKPPRVPTTAPITVSSDTDDVEVSAVVVEDAEVTVTVAVELAVDVVADVSKIVIFNVPDAVFGLLSQSMAQIVSK